MDNTKSSSTADSLPQPVDMKGYGEPKEPANGEEVSMHEHTDLNAKAISVTLSRLKDVPVRIDYKAAEESERIRKLNEMIEGVEL